MKDRVALVTGSTRGIGNAIAHRLAAEGARVVVHGRDERVVAAAAREIKGAMGFAADMADPYALRAMCEHIRREWGPIDVLVNNAGTSSQGLFLESTDEDWERMHAVNLQGPRNLLREVVPDMCRRHWGRILNVTSEAGVRGTRGFSAYGASKGALLAMSLALAAELVPSGVRVNVLAPLAETDLVRSQVPEESLKLLRAKGIPTVYDCAAEATALLASDAPAGQVVIMHFGHRPSEVINGLAGQA